MVPGSIPGGNIFYCFSVSQFLGYSMTSSGQRSSLPGRPVTLEDELKLTLKFDNCPSRNLPTKLQLEIKDSKGNVVFRKRQNIYYVKLQVRKSWFHWCLCLKVRIRIPVLKMKPRLKVHLINSPACFGLGYFQSKLRLI